MVFPEVNVTLRDIIDLKLFYWCLSAVETLIDRLHDSWFISVGCSVSSDVHLCLFAAVTSDKEEEMIASLQSSVTHIKEWLKYIYFLNLVKKKKKLHKIKWQNLKVETSFQIKSNTTYRVCWIAGMLTDAY